MGSTGAQDALQASTAENKRLLERSYGLALPTLGREYGLIQGALSQGEPDYLKSAYAATRGSERESMAQGGIGRLGASQGQKRGALAAGNVGAVSPQMLGGQMAEALYGSRVQEASGNLEQMNKLLGFGLGQSQQAGSAALGATGTELQNIQGMRNYNPTYANILGALNLGGSIYGAGSQAGLFGQADEE